MALFYVTLNLEVPTFAETDNLGDTEDASGDILRAIREMVTEKEWLLVSHSILPAS